MILTQYGAPITPTPQVLLSSQGRTTTPRSNKTSWMCSTSACRNLSVDFVGGMSLIACSERKRGGCMMPSIRSSLQKTLVKLSASHGTNTTTWPFTGNPATKSAGKEWSGSVESSLPAPCVIITSREAALAGWHGNY